MSTSGYRLLAMLLFAASATAAPPEIMVQGRLSTQAGTAAPDGSYGLTVRIFAAETGGVALHEESFGAANSVVVKQGVFSVPLGAGTPLPPDLFVGTEARFVEVQVELEEPLPRMPLRSVPWALNAGTADTLACTGCVMPSHLGFEVYTKQETYSKQEVYSRQETYSKQEVDTMLAALDARFDEYLPLAGGTVTGPVLIQNTLEVGGLATFLNGTTLTGTEWQAARVHNAAEPPTECVPAAEGQLYWDTGTKRLCLCDASEWVCGGLAPPEPDGSADNPAPSCASLSGKPTGFYFIDPDGAGPIVAAETHCEMTTGTGGWTLAAAWDTTSVPERWGTTTINAPSLSQKFQLPFSAWFPQPTAVMLRYVPTGSTVQTTLSGTWDNDTGFGTRVAAAGSNYLVFADARSATTRRGICIHNSQYDNDFNCDGDSGQIAGVGLYEPNAGNEVCGCTGAPFWKSETGGCTVETCSATGLVLVYFK